MLRLAERHKVPRRAFLDAYMGHELDEGWVERVCGIDKKWTAFCEAEAGALERIRTEIGDDEWFEAEGRPKESRALFEEVALADELAGVMGDDVYVDLTPPEDALSHQRQRLYDGLRLATIVICVGAANSLANPKRCRCLPTMRRRSRCSAMMRTSRRW